MCVWIIRSAQNLCRWHAICLVLFCSSSLSRSRSSSPTLPVILSSIFRWLVRPRKICFRIEKRMWIKQRHRTRNVSVYQCDLWWCCASLFVPCGSSVENDYPLLEMKRKRQEKRWNGGVGGGENKDNNKTRWSLKMNMKQCNLYCTTTTTCPTTYKFCFARIQSKRKRRKNSRELMSVYAKI